MHLTSIISVFIASATIVTAVPPSDRSIRIDKGLRLIKTSEADPGIWVTDEEKIVNYVSKKIGFIDVTDITASKM